VDVNFASHFELPSASSKYKQMVARLPAVFAGSSDDLVDIVKGLAVHVAAEYDVQASAIPNSYMIVSTNALNCPAGVTSYYVLPLSSQWCVVAYVAFSCTLWFHRINCNLLSTYPTYGS
jgi:hypothetical protein